MVSFLTFGRYQRPVQETISYIERIAIPEDKFDLFMQLEQWRKAFEVAAKLKDPPRLIEVLSLSFALFIKSFDRFGSGWACMQRSTAGTSGTRYAVQAVDSILNIMTKRSFEYTLLYTYDANKQKKRASHYFSHGQPFPVRPRLSSS